jgi:hypothetical protein
MRVLPAVFVFALLPAAPAAAKDAAPGADRWSGPFESPAGFHVVERAP